MSIELVTGAFGSLENCYDTFVEQGVDCDITLPDYCPDVMRILKCTVESSVTSSKLTGDRASVDGAARITVVYADENNGISSYEQDYPFSKYTQLPSAFDDAALTVSVRTEYVNCRAVSKRRIDVHGVISVRFRVSRIASDQVITDASGDGIQLKKKTVDGSEAVCRTAKTFRLEEEDAIGDDKPAAARILSVSSAPVLTESKLIKGKILIKGELAVRVCYIADGAVNETVCADFSLPFNEIIEAENADESCELDIRLNADRTQAELKADGEGALRYISLSADVTADVTAYRSCSVSVITDAYSTGRDIRTGYRLMNVVRLCRVINESFMCRDQLDLASLDPQRIFAVSAGKPESRETFGEGRITVEGKIPVSIILIGRDGVPVYCEREAAFEFSRPMETGEDMYCDSDVTVTGCSCSMSSDGRADFKAELYISAAVFKRTGERIIVSLEADETSAEKSRTPSLTVYFCDGDESLWDIARRYNTTVQDIARENDITGDSTGDRKMLLIPVK